LGNRRIEYAVVKGTSSRYTYFRFRPDLTLEVILPRGRSVDVEKTIKERSEWLRREYQRRSKTSNVLSQDAVLFDGKLLKVIFSNGPGEGLRPDLPRHEIYVNTVDRMRLRELVRRWFLSETSAYVVKKVAESAPRLGVKPKRVDVREIGKWGYCTRNGRLSFSWQLIALSERLREYVVLHELTHLLEFNHSSAFSRKLAKFCPDFRERERELDLIIPYDRLAPPE
jgi:predicted metal-dependent hydrolase